MAEDILVNDVDKKNKKKYLSNKLKDRENKFFLKFKKKNIWNKNAGIGEEENNGNPFKIWRPVWEVTGQRCFRGKISCQLLPRPMVECYSIEQKKDTKN